MPGYIIAEVEITDPAGFEEYRKQVSATIEKYGGRYVVRGGGSLFAFVVGERSPAEAGFHLVGAHTDSPNLRLKPLPDVSREGVQLLHRLEERGTRLVGCSEYLREWVSRERD